MMRELGYGAAAVAAVGVLGLCADTDPGTVSHAVHDAVMVASVVAVVLVVGIVAAVVLYARRQPRRGVLVEAAPSPLPPRAARPPATRRWHCVVRVHTTRGGVYVAKRGVVELAAPDHAAVEREVLARFEAAYPPRQGERYVCLATPYTGS